MLRRLAFSAAALCAAASPAFAPAFAQAGPVYYPPMAGPPWPTTVMVPQAGAPQTGAAPMAAYPYPYSYPMPVYQPVMAAPVAPSSAAPSGAAPAAAAQAYPPVNPLVNTQAYPAPDPRWAEMTERCRKVYGDRGIGGGLIGGVLGGIAGNRIASGNRLLGTVVGGVAGAAVGAIVDKAEDKALRRECDAYFAAAQQGGAYGYPGAYPGYAPYGYMMVPVITGPQQPCVETTTVTEKWVDVPARRRVAPRRAPVIREKRIRDKRVYTG